MHLQRFAFLSAVIAAAGLPARAQPSTQDIGVWAGLMATPHGALVPVDPSAPALMAGGKTRFALRGARWALPHNAHNTILGASLYRRSNATTITSATIAYFHPGCVDCSGVAMIGGEVLTPKRMIGGNSWVAAEFGAALSAGYGRDRDWNYTSAAFTLPVSITFGPRTGSRVSTFFSPRVAFAGRNGDVGTAILFGGGVGWTTRTGHGIQIAASRIRIDGAITNVGVTWLWNRSRS